MEPIEEQTKKKPGRRSARATFRQITEQIPPLFDLTGGDIDYIAKRLCVERAHVLAAVLLDTRRKGPQPERFLRLVAGRTA